jgi:hypothetical protein
MAMPDGAQSTQIIWRADIDSLAFYPTEHRGQCVIHRRAFRALLGFDAQQQDCLNCFEMRRATFERAAQTKIQRGKLAATSNFHLNSRDIQRADADTAAL